MFYRFTLAILLLICSPLSAAEPLSVSRDTVDEDVQLSGNAQFIQPNFIQPNFIQPNFIQQRALGPIKLQSGLPEAASRLTTSSELQLSLTHNNVFMGGVINSERLILDGEGSQFNLRYRRSLNSCWQLNVSGVVLAHSNGWFDRPLDDWHQLFGLPDAQRGDWPSNQLGYEYDNGITSQTLSANTRGIGDAQIQVQRYLGCDRNAAIARIGIKIPLGEPSEFNGNAGIDAFVDLQSKWVRSRRYSRVHWAASVGLLGIGENELLVKARPIVGFGVAGLNIALTQRSQLLVQLDWHTPMFDSELRELGNASAQLSLGWRYQARSNGAWELSFSEDVTVDTVPDIVVRLAWVLRFNNAFVSNASNSK